MKRHERIKSALLHRNITLLSLFCGRVRIVTAHKGAGHVRLQSVPKHGTGWPRLRSSGRAIQNQETTPLGFDSKAAVEGVRFNGFYLFASFQKDRSGR
jgi:hypothetical protein